MIKLPHTANVLGLDVYVKLSKVCKGYNSESNLTTVCFT